MSSNLCFSGMYYVTRWSTEGLLSKCRTNMNSIFYECRSFFGDPCAYFLPDVNIGHRDILGGVSRKGRYSYIRYFFSKLGHPCGFSMPWADSIGVAVWKLFLGEIIYEDSLARQVGETLHLGVCLGLGR